MTAAVTLQKTGQVIEIVPGKQVPAPEIPREAVPRYGFVRLMRLNDGTYLPQLQTWGETIRLSSETARDLGLDIHYNTIYRLFNGGFIGGSRISPNTILLDLQSLYDHINATRDPSFWSPERIKRYRQSI